jgi:hypothetical protein
MPSNPFKMNSDKPVDKIIDGSILGAAIGAGFEAIRTGKSGIADGLVSGVLLGAAWRGVTIVSDRTGLTNQLNKAKDKVLRRK